MAAMNKNNICLGAPLCNVLILKKTPQSTTNINTFDSFTLKVDMKTG